MLNIAKENRKRFKPDLAPLIDVVFLLIIFYMLTFAVAGQGLGVKLPQGTSSNNNDEKPLTIKIYREDDIRIGDKSIDLNNLKEFLQLEIAGRKNKAVVVHTSDKTRYEIFIKVFDLAQQAGASKFSLVM